MSTPINHHFVSRVHSSKFFNASRATYLYNKEKKGFSKHTSNKQLFSQNYLNTTITENGEVDHSSVEDNLNLNFETSFNRHYEKITSAVTKYNIQEGVGSKLPDSESLNESVRHMIGMGIVSEMRTPYHMAEQEAAILGALFEIAQIATDELKAEIYGTYRSLSGVTNKFPINFKEMSDELTRLMGDTTYAIFVAPKDFYFLLPDCGSVVKRYKLDEDDIVDGVVMKIPQEKLGQY